MIPYTYVIVPFRESKLRVLAQPVIWFAILYDGPTSEAREYAAPFRSIGPLMTQEGEATIQELAKLTFMDEDSPSCSKDFTSLRYPIGLKSYNTEAVRKVYNEIDETIQRVPELSGSVFLLEGYSTQAVQAVDERTTAFPHREDNILVTSYVQYKPDPALYSAAEELGKKMRAYLQEGSDDPTHLRAYVNYAHGDESLEEVYGWDEWRLKKLRELKALWDPENRMRFYVPIV